MTVSNRKRPLQAKNARNSVRVHVSYRAILRRRAFRPWYAKQEPTFSDAIAAVRRALWCPPHFSMSRPGNDVIEIPKTLLQKSVQTVCYAA